MQGKDSFLCVCLSKEDNNYICYKISNVVFERLRGVRRSVSGSDELVKAKGYLLLSDIVETYKPEKEWTKLSSEDKLTNFTVKSGDLFLYDTSVAPTGKFSDLLENSSNAFEIVAYDTYINGSSLDGIEIEVL